MQRMNFVADSLSEAIWRERVHDGSDDDDNNGKKKEGKSSQGTLKARLHVRVSHGPGRGPLVCDVYIHRHDSSSWILSRDSTRLYPIDSFTSEGHIY